jgi:glucokinase
MSRLAADVGGTWTRLALLDGREPRTRRYRNAGFADLYQVIERFLRDAQVAAGTIEHMVLALPGPVGEAPVHLTNLGWVVEHERLRACCPRAHIHLLNDFQGAAVGALHASEGRWLNPHAAAPAGRGLAVVTGPGTGLGLAWCADVAAAALPRASEGGHADFAPADAGQRALHARLARRHGHVSWERVLSGPGLSELHAFLAVTEAPLSPEQVRQHAESGDATSREAIALFLRILGNWVGNLALLFRPAAGVWLCGGVAQHLARWFAGDAFLEGFLARGRMQAVARETPVRLVEQADVGLAGVIHLARELTP